MKKSTILVTGGASFIGSHLVEALVRAGHRVRVADDLSSGRLHNLDQVRGDVEFMKLDLRQEGAALLATAGVSRVMHLAADHGGRGYIDQYPGNCALNTLLDATVYRAALTNGVEHITFASSACVYPTELQASSMLDDVVLLREDILDPHNPVGASPDGAYGWAKLTGEVALAALQRQHGIGAASVRIFSAYGPRENTSHAVMAMIARGHAGQDPFEIWGDGRQRRNFTYVADIADVLVAASETISDGTAVNAGLSETFTVQETAERVNSLLGHAPEYLHILDAPVGVVSRAASGDRSRSVLGFAPSTDLALGLPATIDWFTRTTSTDSASELLGSLSSRGVLA